MRKRKRFTCSLYRFYDSDNTLLYVGVTVDLERRLAEHLNEKHWYTDMERIKVEHFPSRYAAESAEKRAIRQEFPLHNVAYNDECEAGWEEAVEGLMALHG